MNNNPVIVIPGIGQSKLILADDQGNKIKDAWPVTIDTKAIVEELKGSLMKVMLFRKDAGFSDKIAAIAQETCEPLAVNEDGTKKHNIITVSYNKSVAECSESEKKFIYKMIPMEALGESVGEDKLFYFAYDPFGDAYDIAAKLDEFISFVKTENACEKVDFICVSLGGVVLRAYLDLYSSKNDVEKVVNVVSALDGSSLIADIFDDKLLLDDPAGLLDSIGGKAASMSSMIGMLPAEVINNTVKKCLSVLKKSLISNCTMMWGSVPTAGFSAIADSYTGMDTALRAKITRLYDFTASFPAKAKELESKGMKFYQICGYGNGIAPVCKSKDISSDGMIDVASASMSSVSTKVDSQPDAAYCVFPERTWFFNKMSHNDAAYNDVVLSLVKDILTGTVDSVCDKYPQFNGTRNIRKLKSVLIPKAEKAVADGIHSEELSKAIADYKQLLTETVITADDKVKELENRITSLLESEG